MVDGTVSHVIVEGIGRNGWRCRTDGKDKLREEGMIYREAACETCKVGLSCWSCWFYAQWVTKVLVSSKGVSLARPGQVGPTDRGVPSSRFQPWLEYY